MFTWNVNAESFYDLHALGEGISSVVISEGSISNVVISNGSNSRTGVHGSPENDTLAVSLNSGIAFLYPGAGNDIVRVSGGGTKNIDDAPVSQDGSLTSSSSGDDAYYFGTGKDILSYGSFHFAGSVGHDKVYNFESGEDQLRFTNSGTGSAIASVDTISVPGHTIFHMADGGSVDVDATLTQGTDWFLIA